MKFRIKTNTKAEKRQAIQLVHKLTGAKIGKGNSCDGERVHDENRMSMAYSCVGIHHDGYINCWFDTDGGPCFNFSTDLPKIISLLLNPEKEYRVPNVGDYEAVISDKGITVGCQNISFETFQKVVDMVAEFKKDHA